MDNANVLPFGANQADFGGADFFVRARAGITRRRRVMRSAGYGFNPLMVADFRA
jgi:hypothetical protein